MIVLKDVDDCLSLFNSCNDFRVVAENYVSENTSIRGFCTYCDADTTFTNIFKKDEWTDMRGQLRCGKCLRNNRERLLLSVVREYLAKSDVSSAVVFERVTAFYKYLVREMPFLKGVEFLGFDKVSGDTYIWHDLNIEHQDMMNMSFGNNSIDLLIHSDVLEHVPDYKKAFHESYRVLKKGGSMIFSCPIFNHIDHVRKAFYNEMGELEFFDRPSYHGNPLSDKGSPVFYHFGLSLLRDLNSNGFNAHFLFEFAPHLGIVSNCNQYYDVGHMWPLVVCATKT